MQKLFLLSVLSGILFLSSCNTNDGTTSLIVRLTDSPGDFEKVLIDIQAVEVHAEAWADNDNENWVTLNTNPGVYDLLQLTGGVSAVIADDQFPAGTISQLRLILGENNAVVIDGVEYELKVPSGSTSGLKVLVQADLVEGIAYSILLDFDAAKSVVEAGSSGKFLLKPVIKAITNATDGAIKGVVLPASETVAVYAINGSDTLSTSFAVENNSDYFLSGLPTGNYTVGFDPGELSDYQSVVLNDVGVTVGEVTTLDDISLTLK